MNLRRAIERMMNKKVKKKNGQKRNQTPEHQ